MNKILFTHNYKDDTSLELDDENIRFTFSVVDYEREEATVETLIVPRSLTAYGLWCALANFHEDKGDPYGFTELSVDAQDALNEILRYLLFKDYSLTEGGVNNA